GSAAPHPTGAADEVAASVLGHVLLAGILRPRIVAKTIGQVPVIEALLRASENAGRTDGKARNVELAGDRDSVLDCRRIGEVRVLYVALTVLQVRVRANVEEGVRPECANILAIGVQIAKVEVAEPGLVYILVGALEFMRRTEYVVERLPQHA